MIEKKCSYCDKVIEGFSEKQADHLLNQHILAKHKNKIKFENQENQE